MGGHSRRGDDEDDDEKEAFVPQSSTSANISHERYSGGIKYFIV